MVVRHIQNKIKTSKISHLHRIPVDNEGEYINSFEKEMNKISKEKSVLEYSGAGSLVKKLT